MKPGRELDALVAEKVMGWAWPEGRCPVCGWRFAESREHGCVPDDCSQRPRPNPIASEAWPHYSTDIAAAWQVVEKLRELHPDGWVNLMNGVGDGWHVSVSTGDQEYGANAKTPAHAICLAALESVETKP